MKALISFESFVVVGRVEPVEIVDVLLKILCNKNVDCVVGGKLIGDGVFNVWSVSAAENKIRVGLCRVYHVRQSLITENNVVQLFFY